MTEAGAIGAVIAATALLLGRSPRSPLLPARLRAGGPERRLPGRALTALTLGFALLAIALFRAGAGGGSSTLPLVVTAFLAALSLLVLLAPGHPQLARGLALASALIAVVALATSALAGAGYGH